MGPGRQPDHRRRELTLLDENGVRATQGGSPGRPGREEFIAKRILEDGGQLIVVQVHADVAKVVLTTRPDGAEVELPLARSVLPDGSRYCGLWLEDSRRVEFLTSYDAEGNEIAVRD